MRRVLHRGAVRAEAELPGPPGGIRPVTLLRVPLLVPARSFGFSAGPFHFSEVHSSRSERLTRGRANNMRGVETLIASLGSVVAASQGCSGGGSGYKLF